MPQPKLAEHVVPSSVPVTPVHGNNTAREVVVTRVLEPASRIMPNKVSWSGCMRMGLGQITVAVLVPGHELADHRQHPE